jgi:hypothetical protein
LLLRTFCSSRFDVKLLRTATYYSYSEIISIFFWNDFESVKQSIWNLLRTFAALLRTFAVLLRTGNNKFLLLPPQEDVLHSVLLFNTV